MVVIETHHVNKKQNQPLIQLILTSVYLGGGWQSRFSGKFLALVKSGDLMIHLGYSALSSQIELFVRNMWGNLMVNYKIKPDSILIVVKETLNLNHQERFKKNQSQDNLSATNYLIIVTWMWWADTYSGYYLASF